MTRALLLLCVVTGCGKTNGDAIAELKPKYAEARVKLKRLAAVAEGEVAEEKKLSGSTYDDQHSEGCSLSMMMPQQVVDPDFEIKSGDPAANETFDPIGGGIFLTCLRWTGPNNPMAASALAVRDGDRLLKECDLGNLRSIAVVKTVASEVPELVEEGKYRGGRAEVQVTVVDWATEKAVSRFSVSGQPAERIEYRVKQGESKGVEAARSVHASMWVDARKKLLGELEQRGVTVVR